MFFTLIVYLNRDKEHSVKFVCCFVPQILTGVSCSHGVFSMEPVCGWKDLNNNINNIVPIVFPNTGCGFCGRHFRVTTLEV